LALGGDYDGAMPSNQEPSEPNFTTAPELAGVLRELIDREPIFHRPEHGATRAGFERTMAPDFWETGASGRRYSRTFVLDDLDRRYSGTGWQDDSHDDPWETCDFWCRRLAAEVYLLTYTLVQKPAKGPARRTRRMTIWERTAQGWRILYHQGTVVE
jgi:hypothetical protein